MATRRMTFALPEDLTNWLLRCVPKGRRSEYVAEALAQKLSEWDRRMIKSCLLANKDSRVRAIEKEFDEIVEN
jgi:hypothetical protein